MTQRTARSLQFPVVLALPVALVALGVLVPIGYLVVRAFEADPSEAAALVLRERNLRLLGNTLALAAGVLAGATLLAAPLAWLVARTDLRGRRLFTVLGVLPLAVPGYVAAFALLAATGPNGTLAGLGLVLPRPSGYGGALVALALTTSPYLFLNLRAALLGVDPALEESARSLGTSPSEALRRVVLPQLLPAYLAGALLVVLHVLGDFGVVSLMRFETFSYAIYLQYAASYDRVYAAWLALMLLALTGRSSGGRGGSCAGAGSSGPGRARRGVRGPSGSARGRCRRPSTGCCSLP
jgi:iron(III) transport system permease protein